MCCGTRDWTSFGAGGRRRRNTARPSSSTAFVSLWRSSRHPQQTKKNKKYNDPSSEFAQSNAELYYDISFQILELLVTFMQDFLSDLTTEGAIDRALITNSHVITIASSQLAAGNNKLLDAIFSVLQLLFENKYEPFIIQLYLSSLSLSLS